LTSRKVPPLRRKASRGSLLTSIVLFLIAIAFIFPIFWTFLMSIKQTVDALAMPPKLIFSPTLEHYSAVWGDGRFLRYGLNSFIIALSATFIGVALASPAAYIFARYRSRGQKYLMFGILSTRMIPQVTFMIPFFIIFSRLHLIDTYPAVILMHLTIILGFVIWLMRSYFGEVPRELEEAALVDGCSYFQAFLRVIVPVATPGLATSAIFSFIYSWNEFLYALIVTGTTTKTIPLGIYNWVAWEEVHWGELTATAILALIPVVAVYFFVQKSLVRGLTMGAIKE
jgi:multiple sugar transport system permease protein